MADDVKIKIFPRNLTAHAADVVAGNPVVSRPESGADNSHPGLEFDPRNLDRGFFPGMLFDFQFGVGARLVAVQDLWPEMKQEFAKALPGPDGEFFLWYIAGLFGHQPNEPTIAEVYGVDGYEVLRKVHDLEPGPLVIVIGRHPDKLNVDNHQAWMPVIQALMAQFRPLLSGTPPKDSDKDAPKLKKQWVPFRDGQGTVQLAVFLAERARYLNEDDVIELDTVEPGGLTRSLCSPWQWDFADCGCYYWAASRPDLVAGEKDEPEAQRRNYLRRDKEPPAADKLRTWKGWMEGVMTGADMIMKWESLPLVINDRENPGTVYLNTGPGQHNFWDRKQVIDELQHLAKVEHTLCVKFLYAHYSVAAPVGEPPPNASDRVLARSKVANEVLKIAIDEMRHFRWVNEALHLLDEKPVFGRASRLRRVEPDGESAASRVSLELEGLTPTELERFIDIERPNSKEDPLEVASLYKNILLSLQHGGGNYTNNAGVDVREQVQELVKLIIDEGRDHYYRALHAKKLLEDDDPVAYLRYTTAPVPQPASTERGQLQLLGDHYYRSVIQILEMAFAAPPDARASMLKQTRRVMHNLHDIGHVLGDQHRVGLLFSAPPDQPADDAARSSATPPSSGALALATSVPPILSSLTGSSSAGVAKMAYRHAQEASDLVHFFAAADWANA